tara:strand:+ start:442 stop:1530 length:1089 start_codon:yes stop_codon:yes gene_type:complete
MMGMVGFVPAYKAEAGWREDMLLMFQNLLVQIQEVRHMVVNQEEKIDDQEAYEACESVWDRDLAIGDYGLDVQRLQEFLNGYSDDTSVSSWGYGSIGNETQHYGNATANAVKRFQDMMGINEDQFGTQTREQAKRICWVTVEPEPYSCDTVPVTTGPKYLEWEERCIRRPDPVVPEPAKTAYTIEDVVSVVTYTDGMIEVNDSYYVYVITLKQGVERVVKIPVMSNTSYVAKLFADSGYAGTVEKIYTMVEKKNPIPYDCDEVPVTTGPKYLEWEERCGSKPDPIVVGDSYDIDDVVFVTTKYIDPIPQAIDDEYTQYTVTLADRTTRIFDIPWFAPRDMVHSNIFATGYTGEAEALIALAE